MSNNLNLNVPIHPDYDEAWPATECDRLVQLWTSDVDVTNALDRNNNTVPQWKVVLSLVERRAIANEIAISTDVDIYNPTKTAAKPMIAESWRFGFSSQNGTMKFSFQDNGPFVAYEAVRSELETLRAIVAVYNQAHEDLFGQCCSNPVFNAWGKQVDMTKLNQARELAASLRCLQE